MGNQLTNRYLRREKQTKVASAGCHRGLSYGASGGDPPLLRPRWNDMTPTARRPYPKTKKRKGRPLLAPPSATLENEQKHRSASKRSSSSLVLSWQKIQKQRKNIYHRFY